MRPPPDSRRLDGVLLLDKPQGLTSNAALQRAKRLFRARRAGHTGTLDPMASGLLPICFGESTKFAGGLLHADKAYRARIRFGERTETGDAEGEVIERSAVSFSEAHLHAALARFRGEIEQVPPMYSALKRGGKALYEYARQGKILERAPRRIIIHVLELESFDGVHAEVRVACSKGTYVRTLAEQIGSALGCGAHLRMLVRTRVGEFRLEDAHALIDLERRSEDARDALLLPVDSLLAGKPRLVLPAPIDEGFLQGRAVGPLRASAGVHRVYSGNGRFLGLGLADEAGMVRPERLVSALP